MLTVFHSSDYTAAAHEFDTTRKAAWVADAVRDLPHVTLAPPSPDWSHIAIEAAIRRVHAATYVDALATGRPRELAESQGFAWDPGLWTAVRASTAGIVSAVDVVVGAAARAGDGPRLSGSLSSGMHHARHDRGAGFCTVNGLVVAAAHAVAAHGVDVTILDVDAHAGGGTDSLLRLHGATLGLDRVRHLDLTTKPFDSYVALPPRPGDVNIEDVALNGDDDAYLAAVDRLLDLLPTGPGHLVLHNAGMDPYPGVTFDGLEERERRIAAALAAREVAGVFVLAGGYTWDASPDEVARSHAFTVRAFADALTR
jgi:acetoin utilization deacetylase AcuC-like enzyme